MCHRLLALGVFLSIPKYATAAENKCTAGGDSLVQTRRVRARSDNDVALSEDDSEDVPPYKFFGIGRCTGFGYRLITSSQACGIAAEAIGWTKDCDSDGCLPVTPRIDRPAGCYTAGAGYVHFNPDTSSDRGSMNGFGTLCSPAPPAPAWTLVARQTYPVLFTKGEWSKNPDDPSNDNYAILDRLETFRDPASKEFEFKLVWPDLQNQTWKQTSNPVTKTSPGADGYEAISAPYKANKWGGLEYGGTYSLLDGSLNHHNWFYAVGSFKEFRSGIPGPKTAVQRVELYVKTPP